MGCQSSVIIGNNLTFSICTHDPDTGVLTDADSAPAYRVYEDETGTAILTGTMTKLDDSNTTGFYTEQIACTAANGFENAKSYTIYIQATVDSDTGGIAYAFSAEVAGVPSASSSSGVDAGTITMLRGDSFSVIITGLTANTGYEKLWFTVKTSQSDVDSAAILQVLLSSPAGGTDGAVYWLGAAAADRTKAAITVNSSTSITVTVDETLTADAPVAAGMFYDVQMLASGTVTTLGTGRLDVTADVTRAVA